jgi:DNA processing protein
MAARYVSPEDWQERALGDLLKGTGRTLSSSSGDKSSIGAGTAVFVAGDTSLLRARSVSVIGSRKVSQAGAARTRTLARALAAADVVVMSGLAQGVDTAAMTAAIDAGGRTIGVIGTPLDKAYPAANARLQEKVYRDHLLVSQFPHGSVVRPANFPMRNRLMCALSDATAIIEASDRSGTLHQARECVRLGRWLFIARSLVNDATLTWPAKFTAYERCIAFDNAAQLIDLVRAA